MERIIRLKEGELEKKLSDDVEILFLENIILHDKNGIKNLSKIELPLNLKYLLILEDHSPKKNINIRKTKKNIINFFEEYAKSIIDKFKIPFNCEVMLFGVYQFHKSFYTVRYKPLEKIEVVKSNGHEPDEIMENIMNLNVSVECKEKLIDNYCINIRTGYDLYKNLNRTLLKVIIFKEIEELFKKMVFD